MKMLSNRRVALLEMESCEPKTFPISGDSALGYATHLPFCQADNHRLNSLPNAYLTRRDNLTHKSSQSDCRKPCHCYLLVR